MFDISNPFCRWQVGVVNQAGKEKGEVWGKIVHPGRERLHPVRPSVPQVLITVSFTFRQSKDLHAAGDGKRGGRQRVKPATPARFPGS